MIEKEIQLLFNAGQLKRVSIIPVIMSQGWCLQFDRTKGQPFAMDAQRASPRVFKTIDAAFKIASQNRLS